MKREEPGYFLTVWQEHGDQVRQLIFNDELYKQIKARKKARRWRRVNSSHSMLRDRA